ncbi:hypothetical protein BGZ72_005801 [Mortierella alpina]|nr:hypothetical protein BGZ72_005801 [Mortierella alpina]
MAAIWAEILKIDRVGRHDNFFMLGGHSLLAVRMIGSVRSRLGIELKLQSLFPAPTIAELTQKRSQGSSNQSDEYGVLLPLKTQGSRPPLFCIHSGLGLSWLYMGLAKHLHPDQPLYGLQARGLDGKISMAGSIEEMARECLCWPSWTLLEIILFWRRTTLSLPRLRTKTKAGDILYFKATVQQDEHSAVIDPDSWRPFTLGVIEVNDIECTHMEMDKPEHIGFVGSTVAARIEELMG